MDLRPSFPSLEIDGTQAGQPAAARQEGDPASGYGSIGFAFKDAAGNVVLPQLTAAGKVAVDTGVTGTPMRARGKQTPTDNNFVDVATITLTVNKTYHGLEWSVACFRDSVFEIYQNDNGAETILADAITGAGDLTDSGGLENLQFTAGATGTQQLKVRGKNLNANSDLRAAIVTSELP